MTLRDYVLIVARSWIVVAVTVAVGLVTAGIVALSSHHDVHVVGAGAVHRARRPSSGQDLAYVGNYVQSRMQTYEKLGTSSEPPGARSPKQIGSDESPARAGRPRRGRASASSTTVATISAERHRRPRARPAAANTVADALLDAVQELEAENAAGASAQGSEPGEGDRRGRHHRRRRSPLRAVRIRTCSLYLLAGALAGILASIGVVALREVLRGEASSSPAGEAT